MNLIRKEVDTTEGSWRNLICFFSRLLIFLSSSLDISQAEDLSHRQNKGRMKELHRHLVLTTEPVSVL